MNSAHAMKIAGIAASLCLSLACASPALAQHVVARVNGAPITEMDVVQRTKLLTLSGAKPSGRKDVLDQLIDEQLKMQVAQRYRIDIPDSEVDQVVGGMAARMRVSQAQFAKALGGAGISIHSLKRKLRADLAWQSIVRGKFQASLQIRDKDVLAALENKGQGG
ncbi:MAG: SurA N-terminal domain-containing protein, partial [Hyphomicrobiales bacterium]|nr:SurA N-terminal domain-containing protein [Hyphomicrobiales bacterium]